MVAGDSALFWPAHGALIVADLHLEKASSYALGGQMLPPYDSRATIEALAALVDRFAARAVWCLGDNYHDKGGERRLEARAAAQLRALTERLDWRWIVGNHDPLLSARWGGQVVDAMTVDGIHLRHEAEPADQRPEMSGHFHPKFRQSVRGRLVSRRCFVRTNSKLLFPAFGALTGGLDAGDDAIAAACGGAAAEALVPAAGRLLTFPLALATAGRLASDRAWSK